MKSVLVLLSAIGLSAAAPSLSKRLEPVCNAGGTIALGLWNIRNSWGSGTSGQKEGRQCAELDRFDGTSLDWHVDFSWKFVDNNTATGYPIAEFTGLKPAMLASHKSINANLEWSLEGDDLVAGVGFSAFGYRGSCSRSDPPWVVTIWLGAIGDPIPEGGSRKQVGDVTIGGASYTVWRTASPGIESTVYVTTFASKEKQTKFQGDILPFLLWQIDAGYERQGLCLGYLGQSLDIWSGTDAMFHTENLSVTQAVVSSPGPHT